MGYPTQYPVFEYKVGFVKTGNRYRLSYYNTPYKNSENELDDISVMFEGKSLSGENLQSYKAVKWEDLADGEYEVVVEAKFIPHHHNPEEFDQVFTQKSLNPVG